MFQKVQKIHKLLIIDISVIESDEEYCPYYLTSHSQ